MANITTASVTDKVATVVLDDATGFVIGEHVYIFGVGKTKIDGHHQLDTVNLGTDTVTFSTGGPDVAEITPVGAQKVAEVTWIDADDAQEFLGTVDDPDELTFLGTCVAAANDWAFRRREAAGYRDNPTAVPNGSVKMGVILYAGALFREKGSVDSFQSFEAMPTPSPTGSMGQIMRLLGIGRARIG